VETATLLVVKRCGVTEPFSRSKVVAGVRKACQGRPVTEDQLAKLGQRVEESVRATGRSELSAHEVGLAVLTPLRDLDEVAFLRFASVYQAFESLEDFESAILRLRAEDDRRALVSGLDGAHRQRPVGDRRPVQTTGPLASSGGMGGGEGMGGGGISA